VAVTQECLYHYAQDEPIAIAPYLTKLCAHLTNSMVDGSSPVTIEVLADDSIVLPALATNLGVMVTELVINALKYAFADRSRPAIVSVTYHRNIDHWVLSVSDNGGGRKEPYIVPAGGGVGTKTVQAFASQMKAAVKVVNSPSGYCVTIESETVRSAAVAYQPLPDNRPQAQDAS
jgi:chemotaxis protein methyltransferase CheR